MTTRTKTITIEVDENTTLEVENALKKLEGRNVRSLIIVHEYRIGDSEINTRIDYTMTNMAPMLFSHMVALMQCVLNNFINAQFKSAG